MGQKVYINKLRNPNTLDLTDKIGKIGIVRGLRLTESNNIALIVEFDSQVRIWFFEDELKIIK
uniref:hypothetical protein n=1 Tax=Galdieria phlegrea TaxID=1389228 RepID=UPI0023D89BB7|nr:hypothetical protein P2030_pgp006 [Galdieria phlegrea]WDA99548.1 hypothetical protein GASUdbv011_006 [Galdieria sulphuraria]WDA99738.1 hypothetical protein GAPH629S_006 [Galdieria phlegrea]